MTDIQLVNKDLPRGKIFVPIDDLRQQVALKTALARRTIEAYAEANDCIKDTTLSRHFFGITFPKFKILDEGGDFPRVRMSAYALSQIDHRYSTTTSRLKKHYSSSNRCEFLDFAIPDRDNLIIQWDEERKGLIVHDAPYEGELVNNKPLVVSRELISLVKTEINTLAVLKLLSADEDIPITSSLRWSNAITKGEYIAKVLPKLLDGSYSDTELANAAFCAGLYNYKTVKCECVLDLDSKGEKDSFKLPSFIRTKLTYMYGGYTLPDDYQDWFNG